MALKEETLGLDPEMLRQLLDAISRFVRELRVPAEASVAIMSQETGAAELLTPDS